MSVAVVDPLEQAAAIRATTNSGHIQFKRRCPMAQWIPVDPLLEKSPSDTGSESLATSLISLLQVEIELVFDYSCS